MQVIEFISNSVDLDSTTFNFFFVSRPLRRGLTMLSALKEIPNRIGLTRDHAHTTPSLSSNEVSVEILAFANTCLFCLHETSYKMFEMSRPEKRCYRQFKWFMFILAEIFVFMVSLSNDIN